MNSLLSRLKKNRSQIELDLANSPEKIYFSPSTLAHFRVTIPLVQQYSDGKSLDIGCGTMPYKPYLSPSVRQYDTLDFLPRVAGVTYQADVQNMANVPSGYYDTALCFEVLEHIPDTNRALDEIWRVLAPGGKLILSVPLLSRLHEEPHDYYRFTRYGLSFLLKSHGFRELVCLHAGGQFCFIGHQISTILIGLTWHIPGLKQLAWAINRWLVCKPAVWLDQVIDPHGTIALGYSLVAEKIEKS